MTGRLAREADNAPACETTRQMQVCVCSLPAVGSKRNWGWARGQRATDGPALASFADGSWVWSRLRKGASPKRNKRP